MRELDTMNTNICESMKSTQTFDILSNTIYVGTVSLFSFGAL